MQVKSQKRKCIEDKMITFPLRKGVKAFIRGFCHHHFPSMLIISGAIIDLLYLKNSAKNNPCFQAGNLAGQQLFYISAVKFIVL
jgi:hypothetical protein